MTRKIKEIFVEGFGSIRDPLSFNLDRPGINVVTGGNGQGKTTLFSALIWCLYGVNLKGVNKDKVQTYPEIRPSGWLGTKVQVTIEYEGTDYHIARHINYRGKTGGVTPKDTLIFWEEGEEFSSGHRNKNVQEDIIRFLEMDSKTFLNSILFGQRMQRLIESSGSDKRELFERIFDVDFVLRARENAVEAESKTSTAAIDLTKEMDKAEVRLNTLNERITDAKEVLENFESVKKSKVDVAQKKVDDLKESAQDKGQECRNREIEMTELKKGLKEFDEDTLNSILESKNSVISMREDRERKKRTAKSEIGVAEENIEEYKSEIEQNDGLCPTCGSEMNVEEAKKVVDGLKSNISKEETVIKELGQAIVKYDEEIEVFKKEVESLTEKSADMVEIRDANRSIDRDVTRLVNANQTSVAELNGISKRLQDAVESLKQETDREAPDMKIESIKSDRDALSVRIEEIEPELSALETRLSHIQWWKSKGFGSNGVKAYVFNSMLVKLNMTIAKYSRKLGVGLMFYVDTEKKSTPFVTECVLDGVQVDYDSLSGGEKQRVDIALAFGLHDMMSDQSGYNILIMDEVFEGLDGTGIDSAADLIQEKVEDGVSVYVITHSLSFSPHGAKYITAEKDETGNTVFV